MYIIVPFRKKIQIVEQMKTVVLCNVCVNALELGFI